MTRLRDDIPRIPTNGLTGRDGHAYLPDPGLLAAGNVALTLGMPLLLTGEPGCGKTEFAFAVASWLHPELPPLECHVHSDSRARDLLYRYDAERRFGDAQHGGDAGRARARDARHYVELRGLGLAMMSERPRVVLIDEIDKAPRDLPNDLLRELDRFSFEVPELSDEAEGEVRSHGVPLRRQMAPPPGAARPLVVITSNVERQLPDPFLRRCAFFHITFPPERKLRDILSRRFPHDDGLFLDRVVRVFLGVRGLPNLVKRPATSELIDWAGALTRVYRSEEAAASIDAAYDALTIQGGKVVAAAETRVPWSGLPGLTTLLKLSEDLETLRAASA